MQACWSELGALPREPNEDIRRLISQVMNLVDSVTSGRKGPPRTPHPLQKVWDVRTVRSFFQECFFRMSAKPAAGEPVTKPVALDVLVDGRQGTAGRVAAGTQ